MKKITEALINFFCFLIMLPSAAISGVVELWHTAFDTPRGRRTVARFLQYGKHQYWASFDVPVVVCRHLGDNLWEGECGIFAKVPQSILKMRVSAWNVIDGKIWIKVLINDKFIKELEEELRISDDRKEG